jgi:DNA-binding transcriptional MocR family regulator
MRLQQSALAAGISISPGSLFSPNAKYSNCIRLSVALPWDAQVEDAIKRLGKLATDQLAAVASRRRQ